MDCPGYASLSAPSFPCCRSWQQQEVEPAKLLDIVSHVHVAQRELSADDLPQSPT